jgi:hypothetical protein
MSTTGQTVLDTALQTAGAVGSALAATDPKVAAVVALAPLAIQLLQSATAAQQAGLIPAEQLAGLFASIGTGIQSTHDQWVAMNRADAAAAA